MSSDNEPTIPFFSCSWHHLMTVLVLVTVFLVVAWIAVSLRLVTRKVIINAVGPDDYWISCALVGLFTSFKVNSSD
jgi:hypothetical protein